MLINLLMRESLLFSKMILKDGKYLIPQPPKRALSSFILFGNDYRKKLQKQNEKISSVTEASRVIGAKWKQISQEEKKKYETKAEQLKQIAKENKTVYEKKYEEPFKNWTVHKLIQAKVRQQSPSSGGLAGFQEKLKAYQQKLTEEDHQKLAEEVKKLNEQNQKARKFNQIPQLQFASFNSYLRHLRKQDSTIPAKADIPEKQMNKYEVAYAKMQQQYAVQLEIFAKSHSMTVKELTTLINKNKPKTAKIEEEISAVKSLSAEEIKIREEKLKKLKAQKQQKIKKLKEKNQKSQKRLQKQFEKEIQKAKKSVLKVQKSQTIKVKKLKDEKETVEIQAKVSKDTKKSKTASTPSKNNTEQTLQSNDQSSP